MLTRYTQTDMLAAVEGASSTGRGTAMSVAGAHEILRADVLAAGRGDHQAFVRLVDACGRTVCSIALAIVRDVQASEDIAQEVFLAAWAGLARLRNPDSFLPWIRQLTRNRAHSWLRIHRAGRRPDPRSDRVLEMTADPRLGAAEQLLSAEQVRLLDEVIASLPDETREVVTLYYREERSVRQVAELLGMREEAVKQRMSRARTKLSDALLERLGETLTRTAPSAAFSSAIAAALLSGGPETATAAVLVKTASAQGGGLWAKVSSISGPTGLGAVLGAMGVFIAVSRVSKGLVLNEQEARQLERFKRLDVLASVAFALGIGLAVLLHSAWVMAVVGLIFLPVNFVFHTVWLPRIVARAQAAERASDPAAGLRRDRTRLVNLIAYGIGFIVGLGTLIWACFELAKG